MDDMDPVFNQTEYVYAIYENVSQKDMCHEKIKQSALK